MVHVRAHTGKDTFQEHQCGANLKPSGVRISRWNRKERPTEDNCRSSGWRCRAEDNCGRGRKDRQRISVGMVEGPHREQLRACWCTSRGELLGAILIVCFVCSED